MDPWLVNPPWQNFSSMYREAVSAAEATSEVERRHHSIVALYFGIAALEAFINAKMREFKAPTMGEAELIKLLRYGKLIDKLRKWPEEILGEPLAIDASLFDRLEDYNDIRAGLTHAKTRGHDVYQELESVDPKVVQDTTAEYIVRYYVSQGARYPYWIFGWNYLNPQTNGHEIVLLNDQQFLSSLRTFGVQIQGGYGWEEKWKDQFFKSFDGYIRIRDLLAARTECEPKFEAFPFQPKLCRRWWTPGHHKTCGALPTP